MAIRAFLLASAGTLLVSNASMASGATASSEAIQQITQAADAICVKAATGGSSSKVTASADVKAELDNLLRKLAKLGVQGAASYQAETHEGVLANQVLDAARESNECKLHVFDVLTDKLVPKQQAARVSSPQDDYLVATHPTTVAISKAHFERWREDNREPYLTLDLRNASDIPALSVSIDVMNPSTAANFDKLKPYHTKPSKVFQVAGTKSPGIDANTSTSLPLISLNDLTKLVHPYVPADFCAYDAGLKAGFTPEEDKARGEYMEKNMREQVAAGTLDENLGKQPWAQTKQADVIVRIRYETIFHQKSTSFVHLFVYYAKRGSDAGLFYPSKGTVSTLQCVADDLPTIEVG